MRRPIARDINQRKRAVGNQVSNWSQPLVGASFNFTPLSLRPDLWLDASDTSTITASSGAVSQWNDKSGNGRNFTQSTGANQPLTGTRTQNGLNVIDFNGSTSFMDAGDVLDIGSGGLTMIGLAKMDTNPTSGNFAGLWGKSWANAGSGRYGFNVDSTAGFSSFFVDDGGAQQANFAPTVRTNTYVFTMRILRGAELTTWINSQVVATDSTLSGTTSYNNTRVFMIGAYGAETGTTGLPPFRNTFFDGFIGELVVVLRGLTNNEVITTSEYLVQKWRP